MADTIGELIGDFIYDMTPKKFFISAIIAAMAGCGGCAIGNKWEYSKGTRVGVVNKFSEKGIYWKTYEGQMALEGIVSSGNNVGANVWEFSIDGSAFHGEDADELAKKTQELAEKGKKVKIHYIETLAHWPWRGSTSYFIQRIEPVEPEKK